MADEEVFPLFGEIELALSNLPRWMKDEGRIWDASLFFKVMSTYTGDNQADRRTQDYEAAKGGFIGESSQGSTRHQLIIRSSVHGLVANLISQF